MRKNIFYIIAIIFAMQVCYLLWHPKPIEVKKPKLPLLSLTALPDSMRGLNLKVGKYRNLFGWYKKNNKLDDSLKAFLISCNAFLKQNPENYVGSEYIALKARDWYPACKAATDVDKYSEEDIRNFFQTWFTPVEFKKGKVINGLFTGYYVPVVLGSRTKTDEYKVPIYSMPKSLITANLQNFSDSLPAKSIVGRVIENKLKPFYTRAEIDGGALDNDAEILAYVNNEIDRLTVETEGSGVVQYNDGLKLIIGFAGTNGGKYKSIASILIDGNFFKPEEASMDRIREFFKQYPDKIRSMISQNESFVFFRKLPNNIVVGSQGVPLTHGISMAVDRKWIPMGVPLWLNTTIHKKGNKIQYFDRLMIAQDAGGSIKGIVRGDIYWGEGDDAKKSAIQTHGEGHYWLLLPKTAI
jgi:membrane-bound lytic murein transglycosylase A